MLRPDYPADLALMYANAWEMAEPGRSRLFEKYLLKSVGDKGLVVAAVPVWQQKDGRRVLAVTVTLTNKSEKPLALLSTRTLGARLLPLAGGTSRRAGPAMRVCRCQPRCPPCAGCSEKKGKKNKKEVRRGP